MTENWLSGMLSISSTLSPCVSIGLYIFLCNNILVHCVFSVISSKRHTHDVIPSEVDEQ